MEIWAHRGRLVPGLPGNTLVDFQKAYELGVYGIETDVCFTAPDKNGSREPIIHHPDPKDCNNPKINFLSLDNFLAFLKIHPTLSCCLEIKQEDENLANVVVDKITMNGLEKRVYITSFQTKIPWLNLGTSGKVILKAKARNPKIKTHLIATFPFSLPVLARKYSPDIMSIGWLPESKLSERFFKIFLMKTVNLKRQIKQVQDMGIKIIGGMVNDREGFEYFANLGVNGIMTDNSVAAMEFIKTKSP